MSETPAEVERLLRERDAARGSKDYARADSIRDEIAALGFEVRDAPDGATAVKKALYGVVDPAGIRSELDAAGSCAISLHLLYEGFRADVERFLAGLAHCAGRDYEVVLVDNAHADGEWLEGLGGDRVRVLHLARELGWAEARNAGLKTSRGRIVALVDLSVEPTGDILAPVLRAFDDPAVGVAGPWGLVSEDLREFSSSDGPEVDAIEGYFLATRRELLAKALIHPKFRWYRHADIDLSLQIRSYGAKAVVVPVPAARHVHRGWDGLDEAERTKRSKRNFYIMLDRWKHQHGLLLSHRD
jgi:cysteinyl-tRNA synthetase